MEQIRNYEHGFTQGSQLQTNTDQVKKINSFTNEEEEGLLDYATRVINNLARTSMKNPTAKAQAEIINSLITLAVSDKEHELNRATNNINRILNKINSSDRNRVNGWLASQRIEFAKRGHNI